MLYSRQKKMGWLCCIAHLLQCCILPTWRHPSKEKSISTFGCCTVKQHLIRWSSGDRWPQITRFHNYKVLKRTGIQKNTQENCLKFEPICSFRIVCAAFKLSMFIFWIRLDHRSMRCGFKKKKEHTNQRSVALWSPADL